MGFFSFLFLFVDIEIVFDCRLGSYTVMISESGQAAIIAILSILAIIDIIGNSLVCVVITRNPDMRYVDIEMSNDGCYMHSQQHLLLQWNPACAYVVIMAIFF